MSNYTYLSTYTPSEVGGTLVSTTPTVAPGPATSTLQFMGAGEASWAQRSLPGPRHGLTSSEGTSRGLAASPRPSVSTPREGGLVREAQRSARGWRRSPEGEALAEEENPCGDHQAEMPSPLPASRGMHSLVARGASWRSLSVTALSTRGALWRSWSVTALSTRGALVEEFVGDGLVDEGSLMEEFVDEIGRAHV